MTRKETLAEGVTLYLGDCRDVLPTLGRVDAVVTSPPYAQQRDYGQKITNWRDLVSETMLAVPSDAQILCNLGLIHRDGECIDYWSGLIEDMRANGWRLFGWYVWDQMSGMAGDWNGRLAPSFEFVFHFNRISVKVNKTKPTLGGRIHGPGLRQVNGRAGIKSHDGRPVNPVKIPDNVIRCPRETSPDFSEHPARFPVKLASELIEPFTQEGEVVCDPFLGSGTTGVAAVKLGRQFIGIEINETYFDIAIRRIEDALKRPDLFIPTPAPKAKQESFLP